MTSDKKIYRKIYTTVDPGFIYPFIPGTVLEFFVKTGDKVKIGDKLYLLEAMKMKNEILSPIDGKINKINAIVGQKVSKNDVVIEIES